MLCSGVSVKVRVGVEWGAVGGRGLVADGIGYEGDVLRER